MIGDQLQKDIRSWLSPPDPSKNHNIARKSHYSGTAEWFTRGVTLERWKTTETLLWIYGKRKSFSYLQPVIPPDVRLTSGLVAGSGKSVLWYVSHKEVGFSQRVHITN
jgi:hypothetical protein